MPTTILGDQWTKGWTKRRTEKKNKVAKKAATVIDGGSGRYHSAHLMKVHMDQIRTLKTEIESLKADQQKEKHYRRAELRATADALVQSKAALAENDVLKRARNEIVTIHARHTRELWNSTSDRQSQHTRRVHPEMSILF